MKSPSLFPSQISNPLYIHHSRLWLAILKEVHHHYLVSFSITLKRSICLFVSLFYNIFLRDRIININLRVVPMMVQNTRHRQRDSRIHNEFVS